MTKQQKIDFKSEVKETKAVQPGEEKMKPNWILALNTQKVLMRKS